MKKDILLLVILLSLFISCAREGYEKSFRSEQDIFSETIKIDEILQINNIALLDDYIVLQNFSEGVQDFYFVYSYPEFQFLYSFAKRGNGPDEYMMPSLVKNTSGNTLAFRDHYTDKLAFYNLTDSCAQLVRADVFKSPDKNKFFWEINMMTDSTFLLKHQGYKDGARELWKIGSDMVDRVENTFGRLPKKLKSDYFTIFDDYQISSKSDRFVVAYFMIDRLEFGTVSSNEINILSHVGAEYVPDFHLYGRDSKDEFSVDRNIICYESVYAAFENVYALYSGKRLDETEKSHSTIMEVYSWDGTPEKRLNLDRALAFFVVDERNNCIYGVNSELADDEIIKYTF